MRTPAPHRRNAVAYLDIQSVYVRVDLFGYRYTNDPAAPDNLRPVGNVGRLPTFGFSVEC